MTLNTKLLATGVLGIASVATSFGQDINHRRHTEDQWRNLTYGSAALGALGLLGGNGTMTTIGAAGALYSASRWQADMHSRNRMERQRAEIFRHDHFMSGGHRY